MLSKAINTICESFKKELWFEIPKASGPQRIEVLESNVGEMKVELTHTKAQIEQMMSMMLQRLQAKSADAVQQKDKSGSTGRGDTNKDSGGAGRSPREEGATGARVGATTAAAAERRVSNHSNRTSDGKDLLTTRAGDQWFRLTSVR